MIEKLAARLVKNMKIEIKNKNYFTDGTDNAKGKYWGIFDKKQSQYVGYVGYYYDIELQYSDVPIQTHDSLYSARKFIFNYQSSTTDLVIHEFDILITRTTNDVYNDDSDKIFKHIHSHLNQYEFYYARFLSFIESDLAQTNRYCIFAEINKNNSKNSLKEIKKLLLCKHHKSVGYNDSSSLYALWVNDLKLAILTKLVKNNDGNIFVYDSHSKEFVENYTK